MSNLRWASLAAATAALIACTSGTTSGTAASTQQSFTDDFCATITPCCQALGRPTDGTFCRALVAAAGNGKQYDAAKGSACLDEVRAATSKPGYCEGTAAVATPSCKAVFGKAAASGGKAPGEACVEDAECAPSVEGEVGCTSGQDEKGSEVRICQLQLRGKENDGPCLATREENEGSYSYATSERPESRAYFCFVDDGLYCAASRKCARIGRAGSPCSSTYDEYACGKDGYCNMGSKTCATKIAIGGACSPTDRSCVDKAFCDPESKKCTAAKATGAPCGQNDECESTRCINKACQASKAGAAVGEYCGK